MNEPLWKLLELTIQTQLLTSPDAACNTLGSFIKSHVHANPSYKERIAIIKRLDGILRNLDSEGVKSKEPRRMKAIYDKY